MNYKLIRRDGGFPPGGWLFVDPRTGMKFDAGDFFYTVRAIRTHRLANPKVYPPEDAQWMEFELVARELEVFTCQRLNNSGRWCVNGVFPPLAAPGAKVVALSKPCPQCQNGEGLEMLCATCGGKKVTGWICTKCDYIIAK